MPPAADAAPARPPLPPAVRRVGWCEILFAAACLVVAAPDLIALSRDSVWTLVVAVVFGSAGFQLVTRRRGGRTSSLVALSALAAALLLGAILAVVRPVTGLAADLRVLFVALLVLLAAACGAGIRVLTRPGVAELYRPGAAKPGADTSR